MSKVSYRRHSSSKNKRHSMSISCKIPVTHFTVFINNCCTNVKKNKLNCNKNYSQEGHINKHIESHTTKPTAFEPVCMQNSPEHSNFIPRRGELIINGSFENPDTFMGWIIKTGVDQIDPGIGDIAHQGCNAARLSCHRADIYQDVAGVYPGFFFQLNFYMSAATKHENSCINIRMDFLDKFKNRLGKPALEFTIPESSLDRLFFTGFNNATEIPAPPETRYARVSFQTDSTAHPSSFVHLDDVSLIAI
ncbi:MAG: hypothetical protein PHF24_01305 [Syntrophomonas sp.]|nr:hypothetical protein [Syntrophomonas sp.]